MSRVSESGIEALETYCICRSTDCTGFMIACDNCEQWYHGDCVAITPAQAVTIAKYYCECCRAANSRLQNSYMKRATKRRRSRSCTSLQQCEGPSCRQAALEGSKYCSERCGTNRALARIHKVLSVNRRENAITPCWANNKDRQRIEQLQAELIVARSRLEQLTQQCAQLERYIERVGALRYDKSQPQQPKITDQHVFCVTCGQSVALGNAMRHMEHCYRRAESRDLFHDKRKCSEQLPPDIICDRYMPKTGTYCKRLQANCVDHVKPPELRDTHVCGAPLKRYDDVELCATTPYCRAAKSKCCWHINWEMIWRADNALDRLRAWHKLEELEYQLKAAQERMRNRGGLLPLILHSTVNHEIRAELLRQQHEHMADVEKKRQLQLLKRCRAVSVSQQQGTNVSIS